MRRLLLSAACLLLAAGAASAQTKAGHYAPYTSPMSAPAQIQTRGEANAPGRAVRPGERTASVGPYRGPPVRHRTMQHHVSARVCMARATARGLHGRAKTHYIQRCEVGRR